MRYKIVCTRIYVIYICYEIYFVVLLEYMLMVYRFAELMFFPPRDLKFKIWDTTDTRHTKS